MSHRLRRRYGRSSARVHSRDVASAKRYVLRVTGGRAYSGHVPVSIRVPVMRERVKHASRKEIASASVAAKAVANYLHEIGDRSADRWDEMSEDLLIASGGRP